MLLVEPPRSNYDLHFALWGIPVRVHPFFWLAAFLLGFQPGANSSAAVLIWIGVMFVSILIHELGHALAIRHYGFQPRITLYHLGGLASYDPSESYNFSYNANQDSAAAKIIIAAAGPAAGFVLAAAVVGLCWLVKKPVLFEWGGPLGFQWSASAFPNPKTQELVYQLIFINVFWGLVNLLPVFPLDGGQIAVQLLEARRPHQGTLQGLWISVYTGGAVAVLALARLGFDRDGFFIALMFGLLALQCYLMLQRLRASGYGGAYDDEQSDRGW